MKRRSGQPARVAVNANEERVAARVMQSGQFDLGRDMTGRRRKRSGQPLFGPTFTAGIWAENCIPRPAPIRAIFVLREVVEYLDEPPIAVRARNQRPVVRSGQCKDFRLAGLARGSRDHRTCGAGYRTRTEQRE
jgi:hypothetical protein